MLPCVRGTDRKDFSFCYDALSGVQGPYAKKVFCEMLGCPESALINCDPMEDFGCIRPLFLSAPDTPHTRCRRIRRCLRNMMHTACRESACKQRSARMPLPCGIPHVAREVWGCACVRMRVRQRGVWGGGLEVYGETGKQSGTEYASVCEHALFAETAAGIRVALGAMNRRAELGAPRTRGPEPRARTRPVRQDGRGQGWRAGYRTGAEQEYEP